jgi:hypothetical protein
MYQALPLILQRCVTLDPIHRLTPQRPGKEVGEKATEEGVQNEDVQLQRRRRVI